MKPCWWATLRSSQRTQGQPPATRYTQFPSIVHYIVYTHGHPCPRSVFMNRILRPLSLQADDYGHAVWINLARDMRYSNSNCSYTNFYLSKTCTWCTNSNLICRLWEKAGLQQTSVLLFSDTDNACRHLNMSIQNASTKNIKSKQELSYRWDGRAMFHKCNSQKTELGQLLGVVRWATFLLQTIWV